MPVQSRVQVHKGADGYGFNLTRIRGISAIKSVDAGGATQLAGAAAGDLILEINGTSTLGLEHNAVITLVKATAPGAPLVLGINRPPSESDALAARLQEEMARAATVQDLARRNAGTEAHDAASTRVTSSISEARARAEEALAARRQEEARLEQSVMQDTKLQEKFDEIESLNKKLEEVESEIDQLTELVQFQREKTKVVAASRDLKALDEVLMLIETQAVDELNERQKELPAINEATDSDIGRCVKEILIKKWEMEVAITRKQLAASQLDELKQLAAEADQKRKAESVATEKELAEGRALREHDMKILRDKKQRVDDLLAAEKAKRSKSEADQAAKIKEDAARVRKEAAARNKKAVEIQARWLKEQDSRSTQLQARKDADAADAEYEKQAEVRRQAQAQSIMDAHASKAAEAESALLANPASAFGGGALRRGGASKQTAVADDGADADPMHPMVALMEKLGRRQKKEGLTHFCKPPPTTHF
jgi:hypothetical protein